MSNKRRHATSRQTTKGNGIWHYYWSHRYAGMTSISHLLKAPLSTFLTLMVIGVALALPTSLIVMLQNAQTVSHQWNMGSRISLFLKPNISVTQAQAILDKLRLDHRIEHISYISPEQGLHEFQRHSGFGDILKELPNNPLPGVIEVEPTLKQQTPLNLQALVLSLKTISAVETVQMDMAWVKRLFGIMHLGKQAIYALGVLLALAVLLIIGNTIRLIIQNRQQEIEVIKLVGGTNHFIRRPFLHAGIIYGFFGGIIAWILVDLFLLSLRGPVHHLAQLYASQFSLFGLNLSDILVLLFVSTGLGLLGAYLAVARQLQKILPH